MRIRIADFATQVSYYLLITICALTPWAELLRWEVLPEGRAGQRGVTTLLAILVIGIGLLSGKAIRALLEQPHLLFYGGFVVLASLATLALLELRPAVLAASAYFGYWLLAVSVASLRLEGRRAVTLVLVFGFSTALMALVTLIDYFGIYRVPGFNEGLAYFRGRDVLVRTLTGTFQLRTGFAVFMAAATPLCLAYLIVHRPKFSPLWVVCCAAFGVLLTASVVAYTRALYVAILLSFLYVASLVTRKKAGTLRLIFGLAALVTVSWLLLQLVVPREMEVVWGILERFHPEYITRTRGDMVRWEALVNTINDLRRSPLGMGFTMYEAYAGRGLLEVHSIYVAHLRAGGYLGLLCTAVFMWPVLKAVVRRAPLGMMPIYSSLVGLLVYGAMHETSSMLFAWVALGLVYGFLQAQTAVKAGPEALRRARQQLRNNQLAAALQ